MQSIFLEGLKTARALITNGDTSALDALIKEHESEMIETAVVRPLAETR